LLIVGPLRDFHLEYNHMLTKFVGPLKDSGFELSTLICAPEESLQTYYQTSAKRCKFCHTSKAMNEGEAHRRAMRVLSELNGTYFSLNSSSVSSDFTGECSFAEIRNVHGGIVSRMHGNRCKCYLQMRHEENIRGATYQFSYIVMSRPSIHWFDKFDSLMFGGDTINFVKIRLRRLATHTKLNVSVRALSYYPHKGGDCCRA